MSNPSTVSGSAASISSSTPEQKVPVINTNRKVQEMALTHGMNVEAIRGIGKKLDTQAGAIHQVISQVETAINQSQNDWKGQDAQRFASEWRDHHKGHLQNLENALRDLGRAAAKNATQQEEISRG